MIRVAIVGLGAAARHIHLPAYARLKGRVTVVAGCDPDSTARSFAREKWQVPEVFEDARAMIEKTRPDAVSICTPPALHYDLALMVLEAGCHVFCEKPLAVDLQ